MTTTATRATDRPHAPGAAAPPAWPFVVLLGGYPLWWAMGFVDFAWIIFGGVMVLYLARHQVQVPRGFGIWLVFLVWMTLSASQLDTVGRLVGFSYRHLIYVASTVLFVYLYNARHTITDRLACGTLTVFWSITVVGGYLGMAFPTATVRTPLSYILPQGILSNELVNHMAIRRFAQYNPDGWFAVEPRPSAPFLYTNNWGNVYSLLLPVVILYLVRSWGQRRFWVILALLLASVVPAAATLNRGMFLGIGLAALYLSVRYLFRRNVTVITAVLITAVVGAGSMTQMDWDDQIDARVEGTSTTEDRAEIYVQTIISVQEAPLFGMGAPRPSTNPNIPPVGTHGQFWIVMHSHGIPGLVAFMGWFVFAFVRSFRRRDDLGLVCNAILLVGLVESLYYGFLPVGLMVLMMVVALSLREPTRELTGRHRGDRRARLAALGEGT